MAFSLVHFWQMKPIINGADMAVNGKPSLQRSLAASRVSLLLLESLAIKFSENAIAIANVLFIA